jgi:hypothetical protein
MRKVKRDSTQATKLTLNSPLPQALKKNLENLNIHPTRLQPDILGLLKEDSKGEIQELTPLGLRPSKTPITTFFG